MIKKRLLIKAPSGKLSAACGGDQVGHSQEPKANPSAIKQRSRSTLSATRQF
jgi:hypothetical protein